MGLRVLDLARARGELPAADRTEDVERRVEGLALELETHLVVALASTTMGDGDGALGLGHLHEMTADGGTRQGGEQRVLVLVHAVGEDCLGNEVLAELITDVDVIGGDGTEHLGLLVHGIDVLALLGRLAEGGDAGDHVVAIVLEILEKTRGVEATGIRENDLTLFGHRDAPSIGCLFESQITDAMRQRDA